MEIFEWKTIKSEYVIKDRWISVRSDVCEMPDGRIVAPYYVLEYPTWVNVVALTKQKEVILVKQYRHGCQKTIFEIPGGCMEVSDASPLEAIKRELLEETGYTSSEFIHTCTVSANPANHDNMTHCFLALNAEMVKEPHLDDTEELKVVTKPLDEVIGMLKNQEFLQALHTSSLFHALFHLNILYFNTATTTKNALNGGAV